MGEAGLARMQGVARPASRTRGHFAIQGPGNVSLTVL